MLMLSIYKFVSTSVETRPSLTRVKVPYAYIIDFEVL